MVKGPYYTYVAIVNTSVGCDRPTLCWQHFTNASSTRKRQTQWRSQESIGSPIAPQRSRRWQVPNTPRSLCADPPRSSPSKCRSLSRPQERAARMASKSGFIILLCQTSGKYSKTHNNISSVGRLSPMWRRYQPPFQRPFSKYYWKEMCHLLFLSPIHDAGVTSLKLGFRILTCS